jgi:hypothetical protein
VVAPIRVSVPSSTLWRSASCCALLKRWISSMNRTVALPIFFRTSRARSITFLRSWTPEATALSWWKSARTFALMRRASVVLPQPGGPQKIIEGMEPRSRYARRALPGPRRWRCPANRSIVDGRARSASGASAAARGADGSVGDSSKSSMPCGALTARAYSAFRTM